MPSRDDPHRADPRGADVTDTGSRGHGSPGTDSSGVDSHGGDLHAAYERMPAALRHRLGIATAAGDLAELEGTVPAWLRSTEAENKIPSTIAVLAAIAMQAALPAKFSLHPRLLLPSLESLLLVALTVFNPFRLTRQTARLRALSLAMSGLITLANGVSAGLLAHRLVAGTAGESAGPLLLSGGAIYLTNVVAFGLLYWEFDRGGPAERAAGSKPFPDLLFPQLATPELADPHWQPQFLDYLYVSFTNATAFSPTDTLPLSLWAKLFMALQSGIALVTVALVVARAVNILK